jgi:hypothetical protein
MDNGVDLHLAPDRVAIGGSHSVEFSCPSSVRSSPSALAPLTFSPLPLPLSLWCHVEFSIQELKLVSDAGIGPVEVGSRSMPCL